MKSFGKKRDPLAQAVSAIIFNMQESKRMSKPKNVGKVTSAKVTDNKITSDKNDEGSPDWDV